MSLRSLIFVLTLGGAIWAPPAFAQEALAESSLAEADASIDDDDWQGALEALERAYLADPDAYYLYRRILVLEKMGETELARAVLEENRAALAASDRVRDLALLEERLRQTTDYPTPTAEPSPRHSNGPSIPLLATGGTLFVGGTVAWLVGVGQARGVRCSTLARSDSSCSGDSGKRFATRDDFESAGRRATLLGVGGLIVAAAGASLTVVSFVVGSPDATREVSVHLRPGGRVVLHWTF